jgi:hypothetical protein
MDKLPIELLIVITDKVATFGVQDLLNLGMTSKCHRQFCNKKVAISALNVIVYGTLLIPYRVQRNVSLCKGYPKVAMHPRVWRWPLLSSNKFGLTWRRSNSFWKKR